MSQILLKFCTFSLIYLYDSLFSVPQFYEIHHILSLLVIFKDLNVTWKDNNLIFKKLSIHHQKYKP